MRIRQPLLVVALAVALIAGVAARPAAAQDHGSLAGQAGLTFHSSDTAPFVAGELGINATPAVQFYVNVGRMQDILPRGVQDAIDLVAGGRDALDVSVRAFYGVGGLRIQAPRGGLRPYVLGGIGFANVDGNVKLLGIDITDRVATDGELSSTELLYELGGGFTIPIGSAFFDAGYRFGRINSLDINVSRAYGGVGIRF